MAAYCNTCGRKKHPGLCDLIELTDGRVVHASRVDSYTGDVRGEIEKGKVKVKNRWLRRSAEPKPRARRS